MTDPKGPPIGNHDVICTIDPPSLIVIAFILAKLWRPQQKNKSGLDRDISLVAFVSLKGQANVNRC